MDAVELTPAKQKYEAKKKAMREYQRKIREEAGVKARIELTPEERVINAIEYQKKKQAEYRKARKDLMPPKPVLTNEEKREKHLAQMKAHREKNKVAVVVKQQKLKPLCAYCYICKEFFKQSCYKNKYIDHQTRIQEGKERIVHFPVDTIPKELLDMVEKPIAKQPAKKVAKKPVVESDDEKPVVESDDEKPVVESDDEEEEAPPQQKTKKPVYERIAVKTYDDDFADLIIKRPDAEEWKPLKTVSDDIFEDDRAKDYSFESIKPTFQMKTDTQTIANVLAKNMAKIKLIEERMAKGQADEDY